MKREEGNKEEKRREGRKQRGDMEIDKKERKKTK